MVKYLSFFALFLLTACGFHLRGAIEGPSWLRNVAIVNNETARDLEISLQKLLVSYNIPLAKTSKDASYSIILEKDKFAKQITNVSASTIPRQYQLIYSVKFSVIKKCGKVILPTGEVVVTRYLTVNNNRILGSISEEAKFKYEMQTEAAMRIFNKINYKSRL